MLTFQRIECLYMNKQEKMGKGGVKLIAVYFINKSNNSNLKLEKLGESRILLILFRQGNSKL